MLVAGGVAPGHCPPRALAAVAVAAAVVIDTRLTSQHPASDKFAAAPTCQNATIMLAPSSWPLLLRCAAGMLQRPHRKHSKWRAAQQVRPHRAQTEEPFQLGRTVRSLLSSSSIAAGIADAAQTQKPVKASAVRDARD